MKKFLLILFTIILSSCGQFPKENIRKESPLAPLESPMTNADGFTLNGKNYKLPLKYQELKKDGIKIVENDYYKKTLNKDEQLMVNLKSATSDFGASLKNNTDKEIDSKEALITEVYVNSALNNDFEINGLRFGDDYSKALRLLKDFHMEKAISENEKNINYYTDADYVSLYFSNDKLVSAAIFSKNFMRDKSYVDGEFVVFGQSIKFPETLAEIEDLLGAKFEIKKEDDNILGPMKEATVSLHSPFLSDDQANEINFVLKNITYFDMGIKDCQIVKISSDKSLDLSVGNIFLGQGIDELKKIDKKNQNPRRLNVGKVEEDGIARMTFDAENYTQYVFSTDGQSINKIEIINRKF